MSSGLFTKFNLSESGLNATDALQKLYGPQVQEDVNLFSYSSRLRSTISSRSLVRDNQLYGLVNAPYLDGDGVEVLRTKFVTNSFTFSENNSVWFSRISGVFLDQRGSSPAAGAPVYVSDNGTIVRVSVQGTGTQYEVRNEDGDEVSYPATVQVNLLGLESGSSDAVVELTVNGDGRVERTVTVVSGGTGYFPDESLLPIPSCSPEDDPVEDKCIRYPDNSLYHVPFDDGSVGNQALLKNERYTYTVKSATRDGFFLYDDLEQDWIYLGEVYDSIQLFPAQSSPVITITRKDTLSSENLIQLYKLNGRSQFFSYSDTYSPGDNLSENIRGLSTAIEEIKSNLSSFVQNVEIQNTTSRLGTEINRFKGKNITSDYRIVFRDPDGVIDDPEIDFFTLRDSTSEEGQVRIGDTTVPGIWLFTGEKYQRVFSSDDKPFFSQSGRSYLSPILAKFDGVGGLTPTLESGDYRYSISAGYYKPGEPLSNSSVQGFSTQLGILVQNLSGASSPNDGGFVFHRTLVVQSNIRGIVDSWPLFSYRDSAGTIQDARILAI